MIASPIACPRSNDLPIAIRNPRISFYDEKRYRRGVLVRRGIFAEPQIQVFSRSFSLRCLPRTKVDADKRYEDGEGANGKARAEFHSSFQLLLLRTLCLCSLENVLLY